jgi:hypothetical protein
MTAVNCSVTLAFRRAKFDVDFRLPTRWVRSHSIILRAPRRRAESQRTGACSPPSQSASKRACIQSCLVEPQGRSARALVFERPAGQRLRNAKGNSRFSLELRFEHYLCAWRILMSIVPAIYIYTSQELALSSILGRRLGQI